MSERAHTKSIANALRRPFATALIVIITSAGVVLAATFGVLGIPHWFMTLDQKFGGPEDYRVSS